MNRQARRKIKAKQRTNLKRIKNPSKGKVQVEKILELMDAGVRFVDHGGSYIYGSNGGIFQKTHFLMASRVKHLRKQNGTNNISGS